MEETDEDLLNQWLMGESKAFERFYHRHQGKVLGYGRKKGIPPDDLSELVQEVFLKLHLYISQYEPEKKALPWFFTIVHNTCIDRLKRGGKAKQHWQPVSLESLEWEPNSEGGAATSHQTSTSADSEDLSLAIGTLNIEQQKVLNMRLQEEMSFEDMAIATGKSSTSLRKAYSRAIQSLRDWFEKEKQ